MRRVGGEVGGLGSEWQVADFVDDDQPVVAQIGKLPWEVAGVTQSVAVTSWTLWRACAALTPRAVASWVLPVPGDGVSETCTRPSAHNCPNATGRDQWPSIAAIGPCVCNRV